MRVCIIGATGPSGRQLVSQALARGHQVVAAVRNPQALADCHTDCSDRFFVKKVDIGNADLLADAFSGCQAVLCALGSKPQCSRINLLTDAVPTIVTAMRAASVQRLLVITAICTVYSSEHPKFLEWIFKPLVIGRNADDFYRAEQYLLNECQDIQFTVVKPPRLTMEPLCEQPLIAKEGQFVPNSSGKGVPRANVASFMLDCLERDEWIGKLVAIQY